MFDDQAEFEQRFDWGEAGVRRLAPHSDVVVIVDVLSFSTAVDIAIECGATVYPYHWRDEGATAYARELDAVLAGSRQAAESDVPYSLSPHSLLTIPAGSRLVLPSPNGATLSLLAAELGATVLTGCLRNALAVGAACRSNANTVAVIAAGERWIEAGKPSESIRFAVEDLVGAGSILEALTPAIPSPEAAAATAAFRAARPDLGQFLAECASGKELRELGYAADLELAAQLDVSKTVPRLVAGAFRHWPAPS